MAGRCDAMLVAPVLNDLGETGSVKFRPETEQAVFTTYGPPGINKAQVQEQLEILESYIRIFAPAAERSLLVVI